MEEETARREREAASIGEALRRCRSRRRTRRRLWRRVRSDSRRCDKPERQRDPLPGVAALPCAGGGLRCGGIFPDRHRRRGALAAGLYLVAEPTVAPSERPAHKELAALQNATAPPHPPGSLPRRKTMPGSTGRCDRWKRRRGSCAPKPAPWRSGADVPASEGVVPRERGFEKKCRAEGPRTGTAARSRGARRGGEALPSFPRRRKPTRGPMPRWALPWPSSRRRRGDARRFARLRPTVRRRSSAR